MHTDRPVYSPSAPEVAVTCPGAERHRRAPGDGGHNRARAAAVDTPRRLGVLLLTSSIVISFLAASAAPTPLYDRYEAIWHGSALTVTVAFAIYALAVLAGLLTLGELSNEVGRRPILLAALAGQAIALVLFATAGSFVPLLIGRAVQGIAAGAALGTLSAAIIESDAVRGTIASAAAPPAGTGSGTLLSGLVVQFLPGPTHTIYLILIAVFAVQALGVLAQIPASRPGRLTLHSLRPRIAVPQAARTAFTGTAPALVAVWGLAGFYGALSPALWVSLAHDGSVWRSALGMFLLAALASLATVVLRRRDGHTLAVIGAATMLPGLALMAAAIVSGSGALFLLASAVAGFGFGAGFQGSIRTLAPLSSDRERPGLLSAVFVVSYLALGIPAVAAGALVSSGVTLTTVAVGLVIVVAALTAFALVASLRLRGPR